MKLNQFSGEVEITLVSGVERIIKVFTSENIDEFVRREDLDNLKLQLAADLTDEFKPNPADRKAFIESYFDEWAKLLPLLSARKWHSAMMQIGRRILETKTSLPH